MQETLLKNGRQYRSHPVELFAPKNCLSKLSKTWVLDPGSGKNLFRIPDPGVKKAPDPDPQHCLD